MRQALEMALEALKDNQHLVADNERHAYVMEYNSIIEKCEEALAQPKRTWVGLTDEDVVETWDAIIKYAPADVRLKEFAQAIEAKLKEKNT